jgi:DNA-binding beta-propeller fold protein YncE
VLKWILPGILLLWSGQLSGLAAQTSPALSPSETAQIQAQIAQLEQLLPHTTDRGAALFLMAKQYTQLGETSKAFPLLKECISLDEGFDPSDSQLLKPLRSFPEFPQLVDDVHRRHPAVHRARVALTVPETDLFPEGLAVDPERHVFYMGSMHRKKIVLIHQKGGVSDFVKPGLYNLLGLGGIKVDPADHSLWAASDEHEASELLHFDGQGKLLQRYSPPEAGPHVLNDLVLHGPQDIYVTDTAAQRVYRFDRVSHSFTSMTLTRPLFYPNGIALSADENQLYIADLMGVIQVDLRRNAAADIDPGPHNTLAGNDGLYWYKGSLLGVQYGTGTFRVMRWQLSPDGLRVAATQVLEYRTPLVKDPTTGAIDGGKFYYIANTGIDNLQDDKIVDPKKLEPVHIAVVGLE